ncbi:MAG: ribosome biogenesis GTPase Der [Chloroflexi bacterium]|nr:ribosome biogenesis GTPase Der [Chloroflexota bacterium]
MSKPVVAIVGKQNVGKSTLLNRAAGKPVAIVEDLPGTTRDRVLADVCWQGKDFMMVDTGGLVPAEETILSREVEQQVQAAITDADLVLFMVEVKSGLTAADRDVADMLRRTGKPVLLVANKADNARLESQAAEFYQLGLGDPIPISAFHGRSVAELLDKVVPLLPPSPPAAGQTQATGVAIVGRPGVGKSLLLNRIVGEERAIVSSTPGTTRDAVDTLFEYEGAPVLLIDTAGIRRRGRVAPGIEKYSVLRSLRAAEKAEVVLLVIDARDGITAQDAHVAGYVQKMFKSVIVVVNKWDLVEDKNKAAWDQAIRDALKFLPYAPIIYLSALTGHGVDAILPLVCRVYEERLKRPPTAVVNRVIQQAIAGHSLPRRGGRLLRIFYATQADVRPPTFIFFVNDAKLVHFSYRRYLENRLRRSFGFEGTPLRLVFRTKGEE